MLNAQIRMDLVGTFRAPGFDCDNAVRTPIGTSWLHPRPGPLSGGEDPAPQGPGPGARCLARARLAIVSRGGLACRGSGGLRHAVRGRAREDLFRPQGQAAQTFCGTLVFRRHCTEGYNDFSLMRASSVLNRQSTEALSRLRCVCQAVVSRQSRSRSGIRRERHCRDMTPISISARFSQLPCFGV